MQRTGVVPRVSLPLNPGYGLLHATRHLPQFPHSGRAMPEAKDRRIREVIYQGYRIVYRLRADRIEIVMVVHGSRNLAGAENQPWEEG